MLFIAASLYLQMSVTSIKIWQRGSFHLSALLSQFVMWISTFRAGGQAHCMRCLLCFPYAIIGHHYFMAHSENEARILMTRRSDHKMKARFLI